MTWSNLRPGSRIRPDSNRTTILPTIIAPPAVQGLVTLGLRRGKTTADILRVALDDSVYGGGDQTEIVKSVGTYFIDINPVVVPVEGEVAGAEQVVSYYEIYFPRRADIRGSDRIAIPGWLPMWEANKDVSLKYRAVATGDFGNGHFYEVVQAGTTGMTQPDWPLGEGGMVSDGAIGDGDGVVIWQEAGLAFTLEVKGTDDKKTTETQLVVRAEEVK